LFLILILSLFWFFLLWLPKRLQKERFKKRMLSGKTAEKEAEEILRKRGYKILSYQKRDKYEIIVDNEPYQITVIADFLVEKRGRKYVVEVKTGRDAPSIKNSTTRRQLLEYYYVFKPDGILLVDMENGLFHHIEFLFPYRHNIYNYIIYFIVGFLAGGVILYLIMRIK